MKKYRKHRIIIKKKDYHQFSYTPLSLITNILIHRQVLVILKLVCGHFIPLNQQQRNQCPERYNLSENDKRGQ